MSKNAKKSVFTFRNILTAFGCLIAAFLIWAIAMRTTLPQEVRTYIVPVTYYADTYLDYLPQGDTVMIRVSATKEKHWYYMNEGITGTVFLGELHGGSFTPVFRDAGNVPVTCVGEYHVYIPIPEE